MSPTPEELEQLRTFLNSWRLPHDTREPSDELVQLARDWRRELPHLPLPRRSDYPELRQLRADLRTALGQAAPTALNDWLDRYPIVTAVDDGIVYESTTPGAVGGLLALVVKAIADGRWVRLKACPDCQHVFYDHSRNRTRTWCGMYAETGDGRACGSIAKVRAYRQRQRAANS